MLRIGQLLGFVLFAAAQTPEQPLFPPEGRYALDRFHVARPYSRTLSKFKTLGSVMTTMNEVRLTPDAKSSTGGIWTQTALGLEAFSVEARLRLSAQSTSLVADGVGIWFTESASLGGAYGISPLFTGFGVVLDTYDNTHSRRTPFLGLVASNGTSALDNDSNGERHSLDSCRIFDSVVRLGYDAHARETIAVHVEYVPGKLAVFYKLENDMDWKHCITHKDIFIPSHFFLGVSASTGDITTQHDLISLKVFDLPVDLVNVKARPAMHFKEDPEAHRNRKGDNGGRVLPILFFTLAFFVVVGGLVIMIKPELLPGTQASIDKQKRFY